MFLLLCCCGVMALAAAGCGNSTPKGDLGGSPDLGPGSADLGLGMPITAPAEEWTFIPFPDAYCANGTTTGIGVSLTQKSSRVLLYLEGGGACWSDLTCYVLMSASYFTTGYGQKDFTAESTDATYLALPGGFFDRTAANNPFKDYSYVYVPYCTGDVHAGDNTVKYGTNTAMHVGFRNITAYLKRLVPTFAGADRVYLAGSSAGGFGAALNWWQVQKAFGGVRVDLIDDSGTPMPPDIVSKGNGAQKLQSANWNLPATTPPGCTGCAADQTAIFSFYGKEFPGQRGALLSYTQDSVLPTFFGITTAEFQSGLTELTTTRLDPLPDFHYFLVGASGHVLFFSPSLTSKGVSLTTWLTQMTTDATWVNESP
jgi:hypothetical protein